MEQPEKLDATASILNNTQLEKLRELFHEVFTEGPDFKNLRVIKKK